MALREFLDSHGVRWEVWIVRPTLGERRSASTDAPALALERRRHPDMRPRVALEFQDGWMAFRSPTERRRLAPPRDLDGLSDDELCELLENAQPTGPRRRLVE